MDIIISMDIDKFKNDNIYVCEKCEYKTEKKLLFIAHLNSEIHKTGNHGLKKGRTQLNCDICNKYSTININNMKIHKLNHHSTKEEREKGFKFYCSLCDYGVFNKNTFDSHMKSNKHKFN